VLNPLRTFRWAVYPSRDIEAGEVLDTDNLCVLRPNQGIVARDYVAGHHLTTPATIIGPCLIWESTIKLIY
jgi:sialic acid synthase SpsE